MLKSPIMAELSLRVDFDGADSVGPGKVRLLELLKETGSIAAAGRAMDMSYRRAWLLIDALNRAFREPVVATKLGGNGGGGAELTQFGEALVAHYRDMETEANAALRPHLTALERALARADKSARPANPNPLGAQRGGAHAISLSPSPHEVGRARGPSR